jgi:hypothetical protein
MRVNQVNARQSKKTTQNMATLNKLRKKKQAITSMMLEVRIGLDSQRLP